MRFFLHYGNEHMVLMLFFWFRDETQPGHVLNRLLWDSPIKTTNHTIRRKCKPKQQTEGWPHRSKHRADHVTQCLRTGFHCATDHITHTRARRGFPVPLHAHGNTCMRYSESPDIKTVARTRCSLSFILKTCEVREPQLSPHKQYLTFSHNVAWWQSPWWCDRLRTNGPPVTRLVKSACVCVCVCILTQTWPVRSGLDWSTTLQRAGLVRGSLSEDDLAGQRPRGGGASRAPRNWRCHPQNAETERTEGALEETRGENLWGGRWEKQTGERERERRGSQWWDCSAITRSPALSLSLQQSQLISVSHSQNPMRDSHTHTQSCIRTNSCIDTHTHRAASTQTAVLTHTHSICRWGFLFIHLHNWFI